MVPPHRQRRGRPATWTSSRSNSPKDEDALIVRLVETHGGRGQATIAWILPVVTVESVDLLECPLRLDHLAHEPTARRTTFPVRPLPNHHPPRAPYRTTPGTRVAAAHPRSTRAPKRYVRRPWKSGMITTATGTSPTLGMTCRSRTTSTRTRRRWTYDNAGNLTDDGVYKYVYDAWNRLVEVTRRPDDTTTIAAYEYDGEEPPDGEGRQQQRHRGDLG